MRLMFKKFGGKECRNYKHFFSGLGIMVRTFSNLVHVEFDFEKPVGKNGENCFSASGMDNAVRFKHIDFSHKNRWKEVKLNNNAKITYNKVLKKAKSVEGQKYDFLAIFLKEFIPIGLQDPSKWYCSEVCSWLCGFKKCAMSPIKLYKKVLKLMEKGRVVPIL